MHRYVKANYLKIEESFLNEIHTKAMFQRNIF